MLISLYKVKDERTLFIYTIHDRQRLLDFPFSVTTNWRRNMGKGKERTRGFISEEAKNAYIQKVFKEKIKDGYRYLYSFERKAENTAESGRSSGF